MRRGGGGGGVSLDIGSLFQVIELETGQSSARVQLGETR